jgi:hypothetical protein
MRALKLDFKGNSARIAPYMTYRRDESKESNSQAIHPDGVGIFSKDVSQLLGSWAAMARDQLSHQ